MLRPHLLQSISLTTCEQHGEKEKFFCEEDQRVLCDSCLSAPEHKDHQVLLLETASEKGKDKLQETSTALQKKEEEFKRALDKVTERMTCLQEDEVTLKHSITSEYGKMHQFLWDEEYRYLRRLKEESRLNRVKLKESKARLSQQIQNLQRMALDVDKNMDKVPLKMHQDLAATLKRSEKSMLPDPKLACPAWLTVPITGLREVLRSFHRDITLDPESANPHLILSGDLKSVQYGRVPQDLPDNTEGFGCVLAVLGAQTFTSGKHYWEVQVGDKAEWELGICKDSVSRKGKLSYSSEDVRTLVGFTSGNGFFLWSSQTGFWSSTSIPIVSTFLDYEKGHIAFCFVTDRSLVYSLSNLAFERPICPSFSLCCSNQESGPGSLIVCPGE